MALHRYGMGIVHSRPTCTYTAGDPAWEMCHGRCVVQGHERGHCTRQHGRHGAGEQARDAAQCQDASASVWWVVSASVWQERSAVKHFFWQNLTAPGSTRVCCDTQGGHAGGHVGPLPAHRSHSGPSATCRGSTSPQQHGLHPKRAQPLAEAMGR